jgi:hypothetical protein
MLPTKIEKENMDPEAGLGNVQAKELRVPLNHSIYTGLATSLNFVLCSLLARSLLTEAWWNKEYLNLCILVVIPFLVRRFLPLFFLSFSY